MKLIKKVLPFIVAFGLIFGCFTTVQAYSQPITAAENHTSDDSTTGPRLIDITPGKAMGVKGSDVDANTSGPDIDGTTTGSAIKTTTPQGIDVNDSDDAENDENLWYRTQNPMKKEHQKLLWEYCNKRNLNYIDMLALIYTESNFNEKCTTGKYFGYFQISSGNCANMAATLKTKNKPLDGTININWGTAMYSWILADKRVKELEGAKKRDVALSIYQRGTGGYDKYGISKNFLKIYYKKRAIVSQWFEVKK